MPWGNGHVVNPAAMAIKANHGGSYQFIVHRSNEKQIRLFREFARNIDVWIVPWACKTALVPKYDNSRLVVRSKGPDFHVVSFPFPVGRGQFVI